MSALGPLAPEFKPGRRAHKTRAAVLAELGAGYRESAASRKYQVPAPHLLAGGRRIPAIRPAFAAIRPVRRSLAWYPPPLYPGELRSSSYKPAAL